MGAEKPGSVYTCIYNGDGLLVVEAIDGTVRHAGSGAVRCRGAGGDG